MSAGTARYAMAAVAGIVSIAGAGYSIWQQVSQQLLLTTLAEAQLAPIPEGIVPPGAELPPEHPPLSGAQRAELDRAMWHTPLDPKLFNSFFADQARRNQPVAAIERNAGILAQLGWRYTPAQQNLILRAISAERLIEVVDRVDGLLRRQKQPALSYVILNTMEGIPQIHQRVVDKLLARPAWRSDYLSVIAPQSPPALLDARVRTIDRLLRAPGGMSRREIAPSLFALTASDRARDAHRLWMRRTGTGDARNLYDPRFREAFRLVGQDALNIPFEWRFTQDLGYSVQPTGQGITIDWDRRGVPAFLAQEIPLTPAERLILTVQGQSSAGTLGKLLAPTITCGSKTLRLTAIEEGGGGARFRSAAIPEECDVGTLSINGAVDTGSGNVTIDLRQIDIDSSNIERSARS
jgi:hypothetical protein